MKMGAALEVALAINRQYEENAWMCVRDIILHQLGDTPINDCTIINSPRAGLLIYIGDGDRMTKVDMHQVKSGQKHLSDVVDEAFYRWSNGDWDEGFGE